MRNVGLYLLLAALGAGVIIALIAPPPSDSAQPAPEFTLKNLLGEPISLASYRGRVVVLDFWASWCKPCLTTFPDLHGLAVRFADRGVVLLAISLDRSAEAARTYLEAHGYPLQTVLWESLAAAQAVKASYGVGGIPRTFVIDRHGVIRFSGHPRQLTVKSIEPWL